MDGKDFLRIVKGAAGSRATVIDQMGPVLGNFVLKLQEGGMEQVRLEAAENQTCSNCFDGQHGDSMENRITPTNCHSCQFHLPGGETSLSNWRFDETMFSREDLL